MSNAKRVLVVCYYLPGEMMVVIETVDSKCVSVNKYERDKVQFAFSEKHMRRALNTLVIQLHEIELNPTDLAMDRIGTHVLECTFGMIRLLCQYKHRRKMILRSFSRSLLLDDLSLILGHGIHIKERVNVGGTKITGESENIYITVPDISPKQLCESTFMLMLQDAQSQFEGESANPQFQREFANPQLQRESAESHFETESSESHFQGECVADEVHMYLCLQNLSILLSLFNNF